MGWSYDRLDDRSTMVCTYLEAFRNVIGVWRDCVGFRVLNPTYKISDHTRRIRLAIALQIIKKSQYPFKRHINLAKIKT